MLNELSNDDLEQILGILAGEERGLKTDSPSKPEAANGDFYGKIVISHQKGVLFPFLLVTVREVTVSRTGGYSHDAT